MRHLLSLCAVVLMLIPAQMAVAKDIITKEEYAQRREALGKQLQDGDIAVFLSSLPAVYSYDVDYPYHPDVHLRYLTGVTKDDAALIMTKYNGQLRSRLFVKDKDSKYEKWNAIIPTREEMRAQTGIAEVYSIQKLEETLVKLGFQNKENVTIWLPLKSYHGYGDYVPKETAPTIEMAAFIKKVMPNAVLKNISPHLDKLREIKSAAEIELLRKSVSITAEGHIAAMKRAVNARYEYEVEAAAEHIFRDRGAESVGYSSITGAGRNATILHYVENQEPVKKGSLILLDAGAEYAGYSADVTRTFPQGGRFTKEQKDIYQIVFDAQEAVFAKTKPGAKYFDLASASTEVQVAGLMKLGLITEKSKGLAIAYTLHGMGHGIGLNVHDPADYMGTFEAGTVFTVEPGIYVNKSYVLEHPVFKALSKKEKAAILKVVDRYDGIGVRIEDDLLVTKTGYENLSAAAPRTIEGIEKLMQGK